MIGTLKLISSSEKINQRDIEQVLKIYNQAEELNSLDYQIKLAIGITLY